MSLNPDSTIVFVSAYAGDLHQVENNLPAYLHHECPVVILSPTDAPITSVSDSRVHCQWFGEREWAGPKSLIRHVLFLKAMLTFNFHWYLMHDADSLCLSPKLPGYLFAEKACWSNEVQDLNTGTSLLPKKACQPSYFFHRDVLQGMIACADNPPVSYIGEATGDPIVTQCIDHRHMQLSVGSGYPLRSFPDGASWETASDIGIKEMARTVREDGKIFIHSVKSKSALDRLLGEHATFRRRTGQ